MSILQYVIVQMVDFWTREISTKCYFLVKLILSLEQKSHCFLLETLLLYCCASFFKIILFESFQNLHYHSKSVNQSMFYLMSVHSMVILDIVLCQLFVRCRDEGICSEP